MTKTLDEMAEEIQSDEEQQAVGVLRGSLQRTIQAAELHWRSWNISPSTCHSCKTQKLIELKPPQDGLMQRLRHRQ